MPQSHRFAVGVGVGLIFVSNGNTATHISLPRQSVLSVRCPCTILSFCDGSQLSAPGLIQFGGVRGTYYIIELPLFALLAALLGLLGGRLACHVCTHVYTQVFTHVYTHVFTHVYTDVGAGLIGLGSD